LCRHKLKYQFVHFDIDISSRNALSSVRVLMKARFVLTIRINNQTNVPRHNHHDVIQLVKQSCGKRCVCLTYGLIVLFIITNNAAQQWDESVDKRIISFNSFGSMCLATMRQLW